GAAIRQPESRLNGHDSLRGVKPFEKQNRLATETTQRFLQSTIDALSAHIAILDETGNILAVNEPWGKFGEENGVIGAGHHIGADYLRVCESVHGEARPDAITIAQGIRSIMEGRTSDFRTVYCCHADPDKKWFQLRATRFYDDGGMRLVLVHEDITEI